MPLLKIQCNKQLNTDTKNTFLKQISSSTAKALGKSENYVMCIVEDQQSMSFAGSNEDAAYVEFKSIGLPEDKTSDLAKIICDLINQELNIPAERTYIEFANAQRHMWGWNNRTF